MSANVLAVSVTERGRMLAARLPYQRAHGDVAHVVRTRWHDFDGFVLFLATGAVTRIVGPLLADKATDPGVVCVDEASTFAVALCGGHSGGANRLAREVASHLGATPVVTTATDAVGMAALDQLPGFTASGDIASVTTAFLNGVAPDVENELDWPLPRELRAPRGDDAGCRVLVTDRQIDAPAGVAVLHPRSLVLGVGCSSGAPAAEVASLVFAALAEAGLAPAAVGEVATLDIKATEPAVKSLGLPLRTFPAETLAAVPVANPSDAVLAAVGTPSVAEAAALAAGGPGAELVVPKRKSANATVAVVRRRRPRGHLALVGLGPGGAPHRTAAAQSAIRDAEVVIGYGPYVEQCHDLTTPSQELVRSPIGEEAVRAKQAVADAVAGRRVALVCSGDPAVYAMASLVLELDPPADLDVEVVPGVSAALAASACLGAPLGHDHASISLSDLLTPWEVIASRLRAAAAGDFVVALYNPRSSRRPWQLRAARDIFMEQRPPSTPVGVVTHATRPGQSITLTSLDRLDTESVGMSSLVIIGSRGTRVIGRRMVTPRGYRT